MADLEMVLGRMYQLERQMTECERNKDPVLFNKIQTQIKELAPTVKQISQDPSNKSEENIESFLKLRNGMHDLLVRTQRYHERHGKQTPTRATSPPLKKTTSFSKRNSERQEELRRDAERATGQFPRTTTSFEVSSDRKRYSLIQSQEGGKATNSKTKPVSFMPGSEIDLQDPSTLREITERPEDLRGYMKKRGEDMFKAWKKRWFQQRAWSLEYFKTHSSTNTQEVLGSIDMTTMRKLILPSDPDAKYEFHVQTDFRLYIFQTESAVEVRKWVGGLLDWRSYFEYERKKKAALDHAKKQEKKHAEQQEERLRRSLTLPAPKDDPKLHAEIVGLVAGKKDSSSDEEEKDETPSYVRSISPRPSNSSSSTGKSPKENGKELGEKVVTKVEQEVETTSPRRTSNSNGSSEREAQARIARAALKRVEDSKQPKKQKRQSVLLEKEKKDESLNGQLGELGDLQRELSEYKASLFATQEQLADEKKKRKKVLEESDELRARYEIDKRHWKEQRHQLEEEVSSMRRAKASMAAEQISLNEENSKLVREVRELKDKNVEQSVPASGDEGGVIKKLRAELYVAREMENDEKERKKALEKERDRLQSAFEEEKTRRERADNQRKESLEEIQTLKFELEKEKRKTEEALENLQEEKNKSRVVVGGAKRVIESGGGRLDRNKIESLAVVGDLKAVANLTPAQFDAIMDHLSGHLEKFNQTEERIDQLLSQNSSLKEEAERERRRADHSESKKKEVLGEYEAKDRQMTSIRSQLDRYRGDDRDGSSSSKMKKLEEQVTKLHEANGAYKAQNSLLGKQIEDIEAKRKAEGLAKQEAMLQIREELKEARKECQKLRQSNLLQQGGSAEEVEQLAEVKRELFYSLALFIKMTLTDSSTYSNLNVGDMYEEAKDMDYHQWRKWIRDKYQKNTVVTRSLKSKRNPSMSTSSSSSSSSSSSQQGRPRTKTGTPAALASDAVVVKQAAKTKKRNVEF